MSAPDSNSFAARLRWLMGSPIGAALGALAYGAWAVYANLDGGTALALRAGALHWATSATLTFTSAAAMRGAYARTRTQTGGAVAAFSGGMVYTYAALIIVHTVNGSPHIWLTLAPGLIPTILFCVTYAALLARERRPEPVALIES